MKYSKFTAWGLGATLATAFTFTAPAQQTWDTTVVLDYWESEFDGDPPNAAVTADGVRVAVTLSDPRIGMSARSDGAVAPNAGAITFTAAPLPGQVPPTGTINQPTVFLDASPTSVNSQVTD